MNGDRIVINFEPRTLNPEPYERGFKMKKLLIGIISCMLLISCATAPKSDLILTNADIYTLEEAQPWASTIVITGNKITAVLEKDADFASYVGDNTKIIDMDGKFIMPGFIDGHTHFDQFSAMEIDADLWAVSDDSGLEKEFERLVAILPEGEWITGGKWDAHRLWNAHWKDRERLKKNRWLPHRKNYDVLTAKHPVFVNSWDREVYFANALALDAAGVLDNPVDGMKLEDGSPTGIIYAGTVAVEKVKAAIKPKSEERILNEMRAGFKVLASKGITEFHDITSKSYPAYFAKLHEADQLTARVWMRLDLSRSPEIAEKGIKMGTHPATKKKDDYLRYGAFKGYMDGLMGSHGALLRDPYFDKPETHGHYRDHSSDDAPGYAKPNLDKIYRLMKTGLEAGYIIDTHAIGDKGIDLVLDAYGKLAEELGSDVLARSRVIHAQTMHDDMFPKFKKLNLVAEVTPSNVQDDMRWIHRRLGHERVPLSHRYGTFVKHGVVMNGGSDIPGAQGATFECHPRAMIHAVVNRAQDDMTPAGGWLPQEKISVHDAIKMYTLDSAWAVFDDDIRGSIKPGKLADLTICDLNLIKIDPSEIVNMEIEMTVVDGKIVYNRSE